MPLLRATTEDDSARLVHDSQPVEEDQATTSLALTAASDGTKLDPKASVAQVKAIAAKISAARRLARKLAEEKAAASALASGSQDQDLCATSAVPSAS